MASEQEQCADTSEDEGPAIGDLQAICQRSQIDFEIDFFERILSRDPNHLDVLINLGNLFSQKGCHRRALQVDLRLAQLRPDCPRVMYNLACSHAVLGHVREALDALDAAVDRGYDDLEYLLHDPDLAFVRGHLRFRSILAKLEAACAAADGGHCLD
ncbi:MAG: TPR end-of-group domain-containing protein [Planctomycetales bacterium]